MGFIGASADRSLFDKTLRQFQQMKKEHEEMTHVLSHDLKAPLRAIEGFSEAILEDFGNQLNPEILEYLREISEGASRMRRLIEDLVTYARLGRDILTLNPLDSREVITEAISNLLEKVEACHATIDLIGNFPVVEGHRRALGLLFECLIDNSLKFRKEGCSPRITIEASSEGPFHLFTLTDNGIGIDAAFYEEVFGVFRRLHVASEFPGSGIGLALARKAAEIHEGRVDIRSSRDNGVTLEVRIPRRLDAAELT